MGWSNACVSVSCKGSLTFSCTLDTGTLVWCGHMPRSDWADVGALATSVQEAKEHHYKELTETGISAFPGRPIFLLLIAYQDSEFAELLAFHGILLQYSNVAADISLLCSNATLLFLLLLCCAKPTSGRPQATR